MVQKKRKKNKNRYNSGEA